MPDNKDNKDNYYQSSQESITDLIERVNNTDIEIEQLIDSITSEKNSDEIVE